MKSKLNVIFSVCLCGCAPSCGDIGVEMWTMSSTVAIAPDLYPACVINAADKFDKQNADKYRQFGARPSFIYPIPGMFVAADMHLTKQKNLVVSLAARILPTDQEVELAEMYIAKTTQIVAMACNHVAVDR